MHTEELQIYNRNKDSENVVFMCVFCSCFVDSSNQTAWKKANLSCKLVIDSTEKDELLFGVEHQSTRQRSGHPEAEASLVFSLNTHPGIYSTSVKHSCLIVTIKL